MAKIKIGGVKPESRLKPSIDGVRTFLKELPKLEPGKKDPTQFYIKWTFMSIDNPFSTFTPLIFDFLDESNENYEKYLNSNLSRVGHLYGAFMTPENYEKFIDEGFESMQELNEVGLKYFSKNWPNIEATVMIGYDKNGNLSFPTIGEVISTSLAPFDLVFNPKSGRTLTPPLEDTKTSTAKGSYDANEDDI